MLVGLNIIWTGWRLMQESANGLMDAALPEEDNEAIAAVLGQYATAEVDFHGLRTRTSGHRGFAEVHVLVPGDWTVRRAHDVVERIEADLAEHVSSVTLTAHIEPAEDPRSYDDYETEFPVSPSPPAP